MGGETTRSGQTSKVAESGVRDGNRREGQCSESWAKHSMWVGRKVGKKTG